jgi:hypothetical protein
LGAASIAAPEICFAEEEAFPSTPVPETVRVAVPEDVRKDVVEVLTTFLIASYPDVDRRILRESVAWLSSTPEWDVKHNARSHALTGPLCMSSRGKWSAYFSFPDPRWFILIRCQDDAFYESVSEVTGSGQITEADAVALARGWIKRNAALLGDADRFSVVDGYPRDMARRVAVLYQASCGENAFVSDTVAIDTSKSRLGLREMFVQLWPKLTDEQEAALKRTRPKVEAQMREWLGGSFDEKHFGWYVDWELESYQLAWRYEAPPVPEGPRRVTLFDAVTGNLVYSNHFSPDGRELNFNRGERYEAPGLRKWKTAEDIVRILEDAAAQRAKELASSDSAAPRKRTGE